MNSVRCLDHVRQHFVATLDAVLQKRFDSEIITFTGRRGQGMSIRLAQTLLRECDTVELATEKE